MKGILLSLAIGLALLLTAGALVADAQESGKTGAESSTVRFYGRVEFLPAGLIGVWRISGREVQVTATTVIKEERDRVGVGAYVEVEGSVSGNLLTARKIETKKDLK